MKKLFFASVLVVSGLSYGQRNMDLAQERGARFGLTAGANRSGVSNAHHPSGARYGFQGGFLALLPLGKSMQYFIQPEVLYHQAGETGKDKDFKNSSGYDALYANNYISVPVYFKMYFSNKANSFFAMGGPRFNFLMNQKVSDIPSGRPWYDPDYEGSNGFNGKAAKMNFAIGLGMGYSFDREWEIVIKHDIGLTNTYKGLMNELSNKKKSEQVISLGVNYIF
ncbi:porin family protein [Elizabethkingia anophelis]|uniref:Outer membrane protein beta-barrel domain-containing protein n=1 Tax=Elizabethkingia anophelis TaxID=1117645 RepID=A0AAU8UWK8_9FLAO|nr:porin family protein [Elizabethkingia anophelis]AQX02243.1 hypothetical protein BBD32_12630 [Elizabethkingia anophelis]OPB63764.1 hypothetical protein BAY11_16800 [Elizabethkingia anophelis]